MEPMIYAAIGMAGSGALATFSYLRSRRSGTSYYADAYGMTPATHRNYAVASAGFFALFLALALARQSLLAAVALAPFALLALLYATSFLRGFSDQDV
jgi:hypothetical protein